MFDFLETREKKRAFRKALDEVTHEKPVPLVFRENKANDSAPRVTPVVGIKNPFLKPETTAIDLKNFKDWRNIDKVKSDNKTYKPKNRFSFDEEEPEMIKDEDVKPKKFFDRFDEPQTTENKDTSFNSFMNDTKKISLQDIINRANAQKKTEQSVEKAPETEPTVKVEVVGLDKEEKKPEKKTTKRKPRGKGKKRFDADVISSIDWK